LLSADFTGCEELVDLGISAFATCTSLKTVNFNNCKKLPHLDDLTATSSSQNVFRGCTALEIVDFTGCIALEWIGNYAFYSSYGSNYYTNLTTVTLPGSTVFETIGASAFYNCTALTTVDLKPVKDSLKYINNSAFYGCSSLGDNKTETTDYLVNLSLCTKLETIGNSAFYNTAKLKEAVALTKSKTVLTTIGSGAFQSSGIISIDFTDCTLLGNLGTNAFTSCTSLTSANFTNCLSLTELDTVTTPPPSYSYTSSLNVFRGCTALATVNFSGCTALKWIGDNAFYRYNTNATALTTVTLPDSTVFETIGASAFYNCTALTAVDLTPVKTSLKNINSNAFYGCNVLSTVNLSQCTILEKIDTSAFSGTTAFTEAVNLSSRTSLTSIGNSAFQSSGIASINCSGSVNLSNVGSSAFEYCSNLTSANFSGCSKLSSIPDNMFHMRKDSKDTPAQTKLHTANFTNCEKIVSIGRAAFYNCEELTTVNLNGCNALKEIGDGYVSGSGSTVSITDGAFEYCTKLKHINLNDGNQGDTCKNFEKIGAGAFAYSGLVWIKIPRNNAVSGKTTIGNSAFTTCHELQYVDFPDTVSKFDDNMFANTELSVLRTLIIRNTTMPEVLAYSFNMVQDVTIYVPSAMKATWENAFLPAVHNMWQGSTRISDGAIPAPPSL
jgi:hypothetical protein